MRYLVAEAISASGAAATDCRCPLEMPPHWSNSHESDGSAAPAGRVARNSHPLRKLATSQKVPADQWSDG